MNPLRRPGTATAHAATAATPRKRSEGDRGPTSGRRGKRREETNEPDSPTNTNKGDDQKGGGERVKGSSRMRARDRGVAVTGPRDAAKRGGGRIVDKLRSTNASDSEGVTDFRSRTPTERTRRECNTRKRGHQGTTSQIARSPLGNVLTGQVNFPTVQTTKRGASRSAGKRGNEATVD